MNGLTKQEETHRLRERPYGCQGKGYLGSLGWACTHCCIYNGDPTRTCCTAQGTRLSVTWQPEWEWSLQDNGYMHVYIIYNMYG